MHLSALHLHRFRSYKEAYFEFAPLLNLICGPNAQGKTTILEAIYYLMTGRSFRAHSQKDLIKLESDSFYIEAHFSKHEVNQSLRIYFDGNERKIIHNNTPLTHTSNLLGIIQGVVMTPDDVQLIKGPPSARRLFLDIQIAQVDPLYVHHLNRYGRAMLQRNQLLKNRIKANLEIWEHEMAQAAAYIVKRRIENVEALQTYTQNFYAGLTDKEEKVSLEYRSGAASCNSSKEIKEYYLRQYVKNRDREIILGYTISGPQKDDLWIGIEGQDSRYYASEGQQRCCVIALRMGEWERLKQISEEIPLLMIDDVGVSLDMERRKRFLDKLAYLAQTFLTTTETTLACSDIIPQNTILLPRSEFTPRKTI